MTPDSRPIRLSEPTATLGKYYAPFIIAFVSTGWYLTNKDGIIVPSLILFGGLLYWFFRLLPLKDVKLHYNYLIISNDFTKDKVSLNDIDSLTTGGWSLYLTRIHFKRQTKFGQTIIFPTMQQGLGTAISDRVKSILKQIQDNIKNNPASLKAIKNCIGKTVSDIYRVQYYFNGKENEDGDGDLGFTFNDNSYLTLTGIGDGKSMKAHNKEANIPEKFNVSDNEALVWKRLDLKDEWKKIIGQTLQTIEIVWDKHEYSDDALVACVLHFDSDFVTFYETCSDDNKFFINERPSWVDKDTIIEKIR